MINNSINYDKLPKRISINENKISKELIDQVSISFTKSSSSNCDIFEKSDDKPTILEKINFKKLVDKFQIPEGFTPDLDYTKKIKEGKIKISKKKGFCSKGTLQRQIDHFGGTDNIAFILISYFQKSNNHKIVFNSGDTIDIKIDKDKNDIIHFHKVENSEFGKIEYKD